MQRNPWLLLVGLMVQSATAWADLAVVTTGAANAAVGTPSACPTCTVGYPYASTNPLTSISFNESEVLRAFNTNVTGITDTIRAWYNDEHALTLGIRRVIVKSRNGSTTTEYPITALTSNPGSVTNPLVGTTIASGDQAATDLSGRPMFPALFVTDTTTDPSSRAGDWQFGGKPIPPQTVFGTWKGAIKTVDNTRTPPQVTVTPDADPAKNNWNLGSGDPAPSGLANEGYSAEARWNVADLKLLPGHSYRLYFMVHDGDQNQSGGDAGQACVTICVPCAPLAVTPLTNLAACLGGAATFNLTVVGGSGPYSYPYSFQWFKGASLLSGQTNGSLIMNSVSADDAGTYTVVVTGSCGSPVTNSAILTVNGPALVVTPPADQSVCPDSLATFSVSATGTGLSYQWYKGASPLAGQTGSSLVLANVSAEDAGAYSVMVSGVCGNAVTNSASLVVNQNVVVAGVPVSVTNCPGTSASFNVNATGTGVGYQWYKGANLLPGQTGNSLTLSGVSAADAGTYSVVASGVCGNAVTNSASLTVNENVVVASAPMNLTNCPGTSAGFNINAAGTGVSYQWYKGANLLPGQSGNSLTLSGVSAADAGTYSVVASGVCGKAVTNSASLTVNQNAVVTSGPASVTNCSGTSASFNINATGTGVSYQWYKGANALPGQTDSSLVLANVSASDAGSYSVVVSGGCGKAVTNSASLTVNENVVVASAPVSVTNCPGMSAGFNVTATGTGLSYQWYKGASPLAGQTASSLTLANVSAADAGIYSVVVSGMCGSAVTNSASLTVNQNVVVAIAPVSMTNCPGASASFNVTATGTGVGYQWCKGANPLAGETASSLVLASVSASDAGTYNVVVSGACGSAVTNSASLTVNQNVVVASAPVSLTNCPGTSAGFSVSATGTGLGYQWYKGTSPLPGQTGSNLVLNNVSAADAGTYGVLVSGVCTSVVESAILNMNANVEASPLANLLKNRGDTAVFRTTASGSGPFNYAWKKDGAVLPGQTNPSLTLTNVGDTDAGVYSVEVGGRCTTAIQSASLTINQPPTVSILSPTNGAIFISPADFTVLAEAEDMDGTVTNVEFFLWSTNKLGEVTNAPYFVVLTNVLTGAYVFTAVATDNLGAQGTSAPVSVTVIDRPPLSVVNAMHRDPATGLFEQTVRVSNPMYSELNAVRVSVSNLLSGQVVFNASGYSNGIPYVQSYGTIAPGSYVDFTIEYYVTNGLLPNPVLAAALLPPGTPPLSVPGGRLQHISNGVLLANRNFLLNLPTLSHRVYYVQYSSDLATWKTAVPAITGTGLMVPWVDPGLPKTDSAPSTQRQRFYRLVLLP